MSTMIPSADITLSRLKNGIDFFVQHSLNTKLTTFNQYITCDGPKPAKITYDELHMLYQNGWEYDHSLNFWKYCTTAVPTYIGL